MEEALRFFRAFEVWIYLLLGLGGLFYIRKFTLAWNELREAAFGLERESAQSRLNQAASVLVILLSMALMEFVLVSYVAPAVPGANPLFTPTLDLLATPTTTLPALTPTLEGGTPTPTAAPIVSPGANGCIPGQIEIASPKMGDEVKGIVEVIGTTDIPNFGFYKYEMRLPDDPVWATIQAGNTVIKNSKLGDWDTRRLNPGEYELGLVVVDNQAQSYPPCIVRVRVVPAPQDTPNP